MRNLTFVLWMLGWPAVNFWLLTNLLDYRIFVSFLNNPGHAGWVLALTSFAIILTWILIGYLIYENPPIRFSDIKV